MSWALLQKDGRTDNWGTDITIDKLYKDFQYDVKGKAVPLQAWAGLEDG
jgi:hypothetical protein